MPTPYGLPCRSATRITAIAVLWMVAATLEPTTSHAQPTPAPPAPVNFGDLAAGPYKRLVIRGAMVIPGHGGPPAGPYDIVIEGNMITEMIAFDPVAAERRGNTVRPPVTA